MTTSRPEVQWIPLSQIPQDLRSEVFVYGRPHPDGSRELPHMCIIILMTSWGEFFGSYG